MNHEQVFEAIENKNKRYDKGYFGVEVEWARVKKFIKKFEIEEKEKAGQYNIGDDRVVPGK